MSKSEYRRLICQRGFATMDEPGATGKFPEGKIRPDDEGELKLAVGIDAAQHAIIIDFGKEVSWLGMSSDGARKFAALLIQKADLLDKGGK